MNLKYKVLGFVAAIGMAIGIAGPAMADSTQGSTTATVTVGDDGAFGINVGVSTAFGSITSHAGGAAQSTDGYLTIVYTDTHLYRNSFFTNLSASDFDSGVPMPHLSGNYEIPASNLVILTNHNPVQGRWSGNGSPVTDPTSLAYPANQLGIRIGDIGATSNGDFNDGPDCGSGTGPSSSQSHPGEHYGAGDAGYWDWSVSDSTNNLASPQTVACGYEGPGTAGYYDHNGTTQNLHVQLTVPAGLPDADYQSTLTVDANFAGGLIIGS